MKNITLSGHFRRSTSIGRLEDALEDEHEQYVSLRKNTSELDKQIDVHKPLVNLLDNLVTMGSLYGGDNLMLTSQYKKVRLFNYSLSKTKFFFHLMLS